MTKILIRNLLTVLFLQHSPSVFGESSCMFAAPGREQDPIAVLNQIRTVIIELNGCSFNAETALL